MRQLTLIGDRTLEWHDVPPPRLTSPAAALVRPIAVGVCDFDRGVVGGRYPALQPPIAVGHEIVAEVIELGAEVRTLRVGMQVVLPLHISCGACAACRRGRTNSCTSRPPLSNYGLGSVGGNWGGGMSDLLAVPYADAMAVPVPQGLRAVDCAAVGCNLVDLHRAIAPHLADPGDASVLLVGGHAHNMALYGIVIARALGAARIDFLDDDPARLAIAESLGARPVRSSDAGAGYTVIADCSGDPDRLAQALALAGPDAVCTVVWPHLGSFKLPVGRMFQRNVTLVTGQPHARAQLEPVLELMQRAKLSSTAIPVEVLAWDRAHEAFGSGETKRIFVRS